MKPTLLSLACLLLALPASAQDGALEIGREALTAATFEASPEAMMAARAHLQIAASGDGEAADWATYYSALADYRLAYAFWGADPNRAKTHAASGAEALAELRRQRPSAPLDAEAAALHVALLGARIGLDPSLGMTLGMTSAQAMNTAEDLASDNPRVQFVVAMSLMNTPEEWGGDPERALALLKSAVATFEASAEPASPYSPTWGHADAAAWLALAHLTRGEAPEAREALATAERLDPNSSFVQYKLKPWLASIESEDS